MEPTLDEVIMGSQEHAAAIIKGKRTKRPRPESPVDGGTRCDKAVAAYGLSPSTSAECCNHEGTTEEEEDMANCLILLAQGHRPKLPAPRPVAAIEEDQEYSKFNSRKYLETDVGSGKIGYYVYECRTCNRTFPSFQALGGHRASHKKPKLNPTLLSSDEEDQSGEFKKYSSLSLQLGNSNNGGNLYGHAATNFGKQGKVHECSICGAEFTSGQALGGHMRRHRAPPTPPPPTGIAKLVDSKDEATTTISLDLDLNLPAPEDRNPENTFLLKQHKKQSPALVFSAPAMVDCHY